MRIILTRTGPHTFASILAYLERPSFSVFPDSLGNHRFNTGNYNNSKKKSSPNKTVADEQTRFFTEIDTRNCREMVSLVKVGGAVN